MAPEQARGERLDPRTDLFSLGATLYRMATGRLPFDGPTPMAVLIALTTEPHRPVGALAPNLPPALAGLIDRLMSREPGGRPQSAAEVSDAVRRIAGELRAKVATETVPSSSLRPVASADSSSTPQLLSDGAGTSAVSGPATGAPRRSRLPWMLAAVALFALVPLGVWLATKGRGERPDPDAGKAPSPPVAVQPTPQPAAPSLVPSVVPPAVVPPPAAKGDPDRKAAEWVLSAGGTVQINGETEDIKKPGDLPKGDLRLTAITLTAPVKEADLSACQGCANLTVLYLVGTQIGNQGLAQFKDSKGLKELYLSGTKVDDGSVTTIKQFTKLTDLSVGQTKITEKGVQELAKALPACRIQHDGGTIEPKEKPPHP
jgi:hypothetical protein